MKLCSSDPGMRNYILTLLAASGKPVSVIPSMLLPVIDFPSSEMIYESMTF